MYFITGSLNFIQKIIRQILQIQLGTDATTQEKWKGEESPSVRLTIYLKIREYRDIIIRITPGKKMWIKESTTIGKTSTQIIKEAWEASHKELNLLNLKTLFLRTTSKNLSLEKMIEAKSPKAFHFKFEKPTEENNEIQSFHQSIGIK